MLVLASGKNLKGTVRDAEKNYFFGKSGRNTEEEYKQLLLDAQSYFEGIDNGTINPTDNFFIYAPAHYLEHGFATDIAVVTDAATGVNARLLFIENAVKVKAVSGGYIFAGRDGRHRFAVAQKYNLNLLVDVIEDEATKENIVTKILKKLF